MKRFAFASTLLVIFAACASTPPPATTTATVSTTTTTKTVAAAGPGEAGSCGEGAKVALQVLGSGGPIPDDSRASASYLVWVDGRARVLIDAGSGLLPRFGAAGAKIEDLDVVALSHLHVDHSAGIPSLMKGAYFSPRRRTLAMVGPSGNASYPAFDSFLNSLFGVKVGAFRYLSGFLTGEAKFKLESKVVDVTNASPSVVFKNEHLTLEAVSVEHAAIPALGYVVTVDGTRIAFGGDQNAKGNLGFAKLIDDVDILVAHHAIPEGARNLQHLHALPSQIGALAKKARVKKLVLSHHMKRALDVVDDSVAEIRLSFSGPIEIANDLSCYRLAD